MRSVNRKFFLLVLDYFESEESTPSGLILLFFEWLVNLALRTDLKQKRWDWVRITTRQPLHRSIANRLGNVYCYWLYYSATYLLESIQ